MDRHFEKGEGKIFSGPWEVIAAVDAETVSLHARVKVRIDGALVETTPGRVIVAELLPKEMPFELVNTLLNKKTIARLVYEAYRRAGTKATVILCDRLKDLRITSYNVCYTKLLRGRPRTPGGRWSSC